MKYYEAYGKRYRQVHGERLSWASLVPSPIVEETLSKYFAGKDIKILDCGCGEGRDALYLLQKGHDLCGVDISPEAIRYCRERTREPERFFTADICRDRLENRYDFIYSVATLHMLVEQNDRRAYYRFIKEHLSESGLALILTMGDGERESASDIAEAFDDRVRVHQESGRELIIAATSCRTVTFPVFEAELRAARLEILDKGLTAVEPEFPVMMYAVCRAQKEARR